MSLQEVLIQEKTAVTKRGLQKGEMAMKGMMGNLWITRLLYKTIGLRSVALAGKGDLNLKHELTAR